MFRNIAGIFRNILKTAFRNTGLALLRDKNDHEGHNTHR